MVNIKEAFNNVYKSKKVRRIIKFTKKNIIDNAPPVIIYNHYKNINNNISFDNTIGQTIRNILNNKHLLYGGDVESGDIPEWVKQDNLKDKPDTQQNQPKDTFNRDTNKHDNEEPKDYPLPNIYVKPNNIFDIDVDINININNQIRDENINVNRPEIPLRSLTTKGLTFNQNIKLDLKNHKFGCLLNNPISSTPLYIPDCPVEVFDEIEQLINEFEYETENVTEWLSGFSTGKLFKEGLAVIEIQYRLINFTKSYTLYLFSRESIQKLANYYSNRNATANFPIVTKIHDDIRLFNCGNSSIYKDDNILDNFHVYRIEQLLDDLEECHIPIRNFKNYKQKGEGYRKQLQIVFINEKGETKDLTIPNPIEDITSDLINEALISNVWFFGHAKFELNFNEWGYLRHYGDNDEDISVKERFISIANNLSNNTVVINSFRKSIRIRDYSTGFYEAYRAHIIYGGKDEDDICDTFTL